MRHVQKDGYHLLDWSVGAEPNIPALLRKVPEIVIGQYVVNTSFESGFLQISPEEAAIGWRMVGDLAHSPKITDIQQLPNDTYDEWLIFDHPVEVTEFETMVNFLNFTPIDFSWEEKREHYWQQIFRWQPQHVLAENDGLYVITRDGAIARKLEAA